MDNSIPNQARIGKGLDCVDCLKPIKDAKEQESQGVRKCKGCKDHTKNKLDAK